MSTTDNKTQEPSTEQEWLGNARAIASDHRLGLIEHTARLATAAFENGEFDEGVTHLDNALRLALIQRALDTTTEGLKQ